MIQTIRKVSKIILFSTLAITVLSAAHPNAAGGFDWNALRSLKVRDLPRRHFDALAAATFKVPVQVTDLPPVLLGSDLVVECMAVYAVEGQGLAGLLKGKKTVQGALGDASYQQLVSVPASDLTGGMTDNVFAICVAMAGKGGECMTLGTGCNGGTDCENIVGYTFPCGESVFEQMMQSETLQLK